MGEALNETAFGEGLVVRGTHYLFGGKLKNVDEFVLKEKELALKLALHPWIIGSPITSEQYTNISSKVKTLVYSYVLIYIFIKNIICATLSKLDQ